MAKNTNEGTESAGGEILLSVSGGRVVVPDASTLFQGAYSRHGPDLVIEGPDGTMIRVLDYYHADGTADLYSQTGAVVTDDVVHRLVGAQNPMVFAQAGPPSGQAPIGQVETLQGSAFATRANGQRVALQVGDPVFEDDLVETAGNSGLGLTFIDETVFSLSANARMILDELVYEPNGSNNSMAMNLVQGTFVFITGQVAPTGDMRIETPVATVGIRGTTPIMIIDGQDGNTEFGILRDPDGKIGAYAIYDKITKAVIGEVVDVDTILQLDQVGGIPNEITVDASHLAARAEAQSNAYFLFTVARSRIGSQQRNDGQSDDDGDSGGNPGDGESGDPETTESIGDQGNLNSSGLNLYSFNFGNGATGETSVTTNSIPGGPGQQQGSGGTQSQGSTIPTNIAPASSNQTFQLSEDAGIAQGGLSATDADGPGSLIYIITRQPQFGAVVVDANGTFTYIADPIFNTLRPGEVTAVSFDYQAKDGGGAISTTSTVTLQILGVNDAPIATRIDAGATYDDAAPISIDLLATALDPDAGDDLDTQNVTVTSSNPARTVVFAIDNETGGFNLDPAQFAYLAAGQSETLTIGYTIVDSFGGSTTNIATVTVQGRNGLPVIAGATTGSVTEDTGVPATGTLSVTDPDTGQSAVRAQAGTVGSFGTFAIDAAGAWTYTLDDANPMVNALNAGQTLSDVFIVRTVDGTTQSVAVTINGADDSGAVPVPVLSALNGTDGFTLQGFVANERSGWSVSNAGDINGDGFDDVIVGTNNADPMSGDPGVSYVIFGGASVPATLDLANLNGTDGFRIDGDYAYGASGFSVSGAGDVNGDGFDDLIVGAPGTGYYSDGASHVVFGAASFSASFDLGTLNGSNGFRLDGTYGSYAGFSVSNAGDINGDGFDDLIVGAPYDGSYSPGASYVVFGAATLPASIDLGMLDGTDGFILNGADSSQSGWSVSGAGDVNGDGFDDLIVGAPYAGKSFVVFGAMSLPASLDLATLNGTNGFSLDAAAAYDQSGFSVSGAGDVNGDGFDDLIIGAPYGGTYYEGVSYVVFGVPTSMSPPASLDLGTLNGSNGFSLGGAASSANSGWSVSSAGDVNGDGFGDLIVGARNGGYAGESYIVFGAATMPASLDLTMLDGSNGFRLDGANGGDGSGTSVSGAGDVNGDGFDDLVIGAPLADQTGVYDAGESYIVYGAAEFFIPAAPPPPIFMLTAAGTQIPGAGATGDVDLTLSELAPVVDAAIARWVESGLSADQLAFLETITFEITDLSREFGDDLLGVAENGHIILDDDGAGRGWFIDSTPLEDSEFTVLPGELHFTAEAGQDQAGQIDLLTTLLHEFGHELGLDDVGDAASAGDLMFGELATGERRLPSAGLAENVELAGVALEMASPPDGPSADDEGTTGAFNAAPDGLVDILVGVLLENEIEADGGQFDLTETLAETAGTAPIEQGGDDGLAGTAGAPVDGFGGFGFAMVDLMVDDMCAAT